MHVFIVRIKELALIEGADSLKINLVTCLRGQAIKLFPNERKLMEPGMSNELMCVGHIMKELYYEERSEMKRPRDYAQTSLKVVNPHLPNTAFSYVQ